MSTIIPAVKKRSDYRQPDFLINHVELEFTLIDKSTKVICVSKVTRNGTHNKPLILDGEGIQLSSVHINGKDVSNYQQTDTSLTIDTDNDEFELRIENIINPKDNSSLEGLYLQAGAYCTQCEAEGFRKITYFLDRPDVLATYDVKIIADKKHFPFLLSNGNKVDSGDLSDGNHWVKWSDPFKKPCYLFALVAGDFDLLEDSFVTQSGRTIALELFVDKGMLGRGQHALDSLKKAMKWDETEFGLEYDLEIYMVVAVDFFNMGAMENKGLNVFNSKFVLADAQTATDEDYFNIEAVIAHEYFHNWTGNRVTCRDWFQLSLKEGLTVFRDQQFSADMSSPIVNRIQNVKVIRERQFAEDASAMSHPIRPDEVIEMNNFYTVTVYDKGSEVIRMLFTLLGKTGFLAGIKLYFKRFDGQAVTCDDFVQAMQDANDKDLSQFRRWYSQSGTPQVVVTDSYDASLKMYRIEFQQQHSATFEQKEKQNLVIPIQFSLLNDKLEPLMLGDSDKEQMTLELNDTQQSLEFKNVDSKPIPSLLHGFSAPVKLDYPYSQQQLGKVMLGSPDEFARWDAGQKLFSDCIHNLADQTEQQQMASIAQTVGMFEPIIEAMDISLALKAEILTLPSFETLFQQMESVDIDVLNQSRKQLFKALAKTYQANWLRHYSTFEQQPYVYQSKQVEQRKMRNLALKYLTLSELPDVEQLLTHQFNNADNMTDSLGVLGAAQLGDLDLFEKLMLAFEHKWHGDPLVLDKWFALHANTDRSDILARISILMGHSQFTINNPNRVRALIGTFSFFNVAGFHNIDGSGYKFVADYLIKLNEVNPQIAARIITPLIQWQKVDKTRQQLMQHQLMRIGNTKGLSIDLFEKITKSLP
ncbi:aminopeptidase N [Paraglaciecola sp. MB-3u-78]|uniref:aminopeptidase N n=1 Tax=Paraglaciecola sp. MB-3u-78 TaxID=2058332 RepID=UPI000C3319D9|nr:aminopeptidase N [Paraglaciecola sp. MB-3u-78]PKG99619.1 aminopeptidase N [Paraglaciecola sp. MB-3u-78]